MRIPLLPFFILVGLGKALRYALVIIGLSAF
jgi:membrane protein YqaA with SNARE-associated domain